MNILFVCSSNKLRSRTAEDYFSEKHPTVSFMSAGTNHKTCMKEGTTPLDEWMLEWADTIYVMENKHKAEIENNVGEIYKNKTIVLGIPDNYKYFQDELIELLDKKCKI